MTDVGRVVRNQTRGITGAFIVAGVTVLLTAETWRLSWERPASHLLIYAVAGLGIVLLITRSSGFRVEEENDRVDRSQYHPLRLSIDFGQLVLQSFVAAIGVLTMYGIIDFSTPLHLVARMALIQVVPLGFGAALANRFLHELDGEDGDSAEESTLLENLSVFAVGTVFFALPLAASIEMNILAASADWLHLAAIIAVSLLVAYLILYEVEFRGQSNRTAGREWAKPLHFGQVCIVYAVAIVTSALLLWGFGYLTFSPIVDIQKLIVLSFPTTVGGAAARVIL